MKQRSRLIFALFVTLVPIFVACQKSKDHATTGSGFVPPETKAPPEDPMGGQVYTRAYEIKGCEQESHVFTANTQRGVNDLFCTALQDDNLNKACGLNTRIQMFAEECPGQAWNPISGREWAPVVRRQNMQRISELHKLTTILFPLDFKIEPSASTAVSTLPTLLEDMKSCGVNAVGARCLTEREISGQILGYEDLEGKQVLLLTQFSIVESSKPLLLAFTMVEDSAQMVVAKVEVYQRLKPFSSTQDLTSYLQDTAATKRLASLPIAQDTIAHAQSRLQNTTDLRELYHASDALYRLTLDKDQSDETRKLVSETMKTKLDVVRKSSETEYQYRILDYLPRRLQIEEATVQAIALELVNSADARVKQLASILIFEKNSTRHDLRPAVRSVANSENWETRRRALRALAQGAMLEDQKVIITAIADRDPDVRQAAIELTQAIQLTAVHRSEIQKLTTNANWEVRRAAATLLARIEGDTQTSQSLVSMLGDKDPDVRKESFQLIEKQIKAKGKLSPEMVKALGAQTQIGDWENRLHAVRLLSDLGDNLTIPFLIRALWDQDTDVRKAADAGLQLRILTAGSVDDLKAGFKFSQWEKRNLAAFHLGRIKDAKATKALIDQLANEKDPDVSRQIALSLKAIQK